VGAQAYAGLCPDGRQIINRARGEASQYKSFYGDSIPGQTLCDRIASYVHLFTLYWYVRPYGVGTLLGVYDKTGPQLYHVEPSGIAYVRAPPAPPLPGNPTRSVGAVHRHWKASLGLERASASAGVRCA
jgi:hypothetical protein